MKTPPQILFEEWSDQIKLHQRNLKFLPSDGAIGSKFVFDIQTISNWWKAVQALRRNAFALLWAEILFRFLW